MNMCIVSGKIVGDIENSQNGTMSCTKFNIQNMRYKPTTSTMEKTIIRCVSYGALADYINNELYEGCNIVVTGNILNRRYYLDSTKSYIDRLYVGCSTVSRLDQEEYC